MLRRMRRLAKVLICVDLMAELGWRLAVSIVGIAVVVYLATRGDYAGIPSILFDAAGSLLLIALAVWIYFDARKAARAMRQRRRGRTS